jgi:hypothetical protein
MIHLCGAGPAKAFARRGFRLIGDGCTKGGATYRVRNGNACLEWLPIAFPFAEGPRVRILRHGDFRRARRRMMRNLLSD